jgi:hypothetical protein
MLDQRSRSLGPPIETDLLDCARAGVTVTADRVSDAIRRGASALANY